MQERSRRTTHKLLALALGCTSAAAVLWLYKIGSRAAQSARYDAEKREIHELVREHANEPRSDTTATSQSSSPPALDASSFGGSPEERRWYLAPDVVEQLFRRDSSLETYDPWCYFRHKTGRRIKTEWPEHPDGAWTWATNSLGLREDREIAPTPSGLRVIVTGDSHTDGFCDNSQSFPHVAEAELTRSRPGKRIEVVNAGNGGFSFYNYLGVMARFVGFAPDAFVVAVYAGNDFVEVLVPWAYFEKKTLPDENQAQIDENHRGKAISPPAMLQAFYSLVHFRQHPEMVEQSLEAATSVVSEMRRVAAARGVHLLVVLIPGPNDVPWGENKELFEHFERELSLSKADLAIDDRLSDEFLARLKRDGVETLDAREILRNEPGPWYWKKDFHMNVRAHAAIGRALARRIESWGGKFAR